MKKIILVLLFPLIFYSCASSEKRGGEFSGNPEDLKRSKTLLAIIAGINKGAPQSIQSSFALTGRKGGKKFSFDGRLRYDAKGVENIFLKDYIFKSPLVNYYRIKDQLYFHFVPEKKIYIDSCKTIELFRYTGVRTDFNFLHDIAVGHIPLLPKYSIKKSVNMGGDRSVVILEDDSFYESIFFKNNVPDKLLLVHKKTGEKSEVYFKSVMRKGNLFFAKKLLVILPGKSLRLKVRFFSTRLNKGSGAFKFKSSGIKRGIRVIKMN